MATDFNKNMRTYLHIILFFILMGSLSYSQDQLFLRKGATIKCKIMAVSEKTITYRDTAANSQLITIPKGDVILAEYKTGVIYIFSSENPIAQQPEVFETRDQRKERKMKEWKTKEHTLSDNILGFYIPDLILGRFTMSFERLIANKTIGITIPLSLTYDSFGALASASANSNSVNSGSTVSSPIRRTKGLGFIAGVDVNYYYDLKPELKYYFGPRIRYGTDMVLGGINGLTFQLQNGIFKSRGQNFTSSFGFGVGFVKLTGSNTVRSRDPKQVYPWASFTWRLGFRL